MKNYYLPRGYKRLSDGRVIKLGQGQGRTGRGFCTRCGLVIDDSEPFSAVPEWFHKITGRCPNDGDFFLPGTDKARDCGVEPFKSKQER